MAAILGGTMRAPLTSTVFAMELTGDIRILGPLLAACVAAFAVTVLLMRRSILTERVARRGQHVMREYSVDPFFQLRVADIMTTPVDTLDALLSIPDAITRFTDADAAKSHKSYPVVDSEGHVVRVVSRSDILRWAREGSPLASTLGELKGRRDLFVAYADDLVGELANRMATADIGRVPILDRHTKKLVGLVARRDLLRVRARIMREEQIRQRLLQIPKLTVGIRDRNSHPQSFG